MAIIKMKAAREMNEKDLNDKLAELKLELSKERASSEIGTVKNPGHIGEIRVAIVRLLTEKRAREIKAETKTKPKADVKKEPVKKAPKAETVKKEVVKK
jgi:ribosomal protein L29